MANSEASTPFFLDGQKIRGTSIGLINVRHEAGETLP